MIPEIGTILYINLLKREDRHRQIRFELRILFGQAVKFHHLIASTGTPSFMGCTKSHLRALQYALVQDAQWNLILEDDFQLACRAVTVRKQIKEALIQSEKHDFQVIMLQANLHQSWPTTFNANLRTVKYALCTAGYLVKKQYIPRLISSCLESLRKKIPVDVGYGSLQRDRKWVAFVPKLGMQRPSFSDIENRFVNYRV